jgi:hypothetical protein
MGSASVTESGLACRSQIRNVTYPAVIAHMRGSLRDKICGLRPVAQSPSLRVLLEEFLPGHLLVGDIGKLKEEIDHLVLE